MVVDDSPDILDFVSALLIDSNYHVLRAGSAQSALKQSRRFQAEIHLLLTDFEMPGMSGIELATAICIARPHIKILMMSGYVGGMLVLNEGWHFLPKPFIPSQLRALIRGLIQPHTLTA